jgi:two-component system NtrC family sensor kinase
VRFAVPRRLAAQLILALTAIIVVAEGVFGLVILKTQEHQLLDNMVVGADQLSRSITSATWHAMLADRREAAYEVMQTIALKQGVDRIRIFNKEGRVTFSTVAAEKGTQVDKRAEACFLCHAETQPLVRVDVPSRARIFRAPDGRRTLAMVTPIYNEPACSSAECHAHAAGKNVLGVLDVGLNLAGVDREIATVRWRLLLLFVIEIALISVLIAVLTRRLVGAPIGSLIAATQSVSKMELDQPVKVNVGGELEELARSFDAMRERLRDAVAELNALTVGLEAKVEERTQQLKAAQRKLLQGDRLASLGQLAASVAHEINNPLSGVLNLSMLMQRIITDKGIPRGRVAEFRRYLAQVVQETARTGRIVSDLLAFSHRSRPLGTTADLNRVVTSTLEIAQHKLDAGRITVALDLADGLPNVQGDAARIQQVVMNLVINAADAMPAGGRLNFSTRVRPDGRTAVLEMRDTGVGIAPEHLPHIFDPFFTTKENGKGVGLGLAVAYGIVQAHGGEIDVSSVVGEGSTFRVILPLAARPEASGAEQREVSS